MKNLNKLINYIYVIYIIICLLCSFDQLNNNNVNTSIMCLSCILIIPIILFIEKFFKIKISNVLKLYFLLFIFLSNILGEVYSYYIRCNFLDIILHFSLGFIGVIATFYLIDVINRKSICSKLKYSFIFIFTISFTLSIGVIWEFYEFSCDKVLNKDYQKNYIVNNVVIPRLDINNNTEFQNIKIKSLIVNGEDWIEKYGGYIDIGLNDTIKDLFVCFIGALIANISLYYYIKYKKNFIKYLSIVFE